MTVLIQLMLCCLVAAQGYEMNPGPSKHAMASLAGDLRLVEKALDEGDFDTLLDSTTRMKGTVDSLANIAPQINEDLIDVFKGYAGDLERRFSDLTAAAAKQQQRASQIVGEMRRTCVSCHVKFRNATDRAGRYPGRANVIAGGGQDSGDGWWGAGGPIECGRLFGSREDWNRMAEASDPALDITGRPQILPQGSSGHERHDRRFSE